jgi:hypothetical protein
VHVEAMTAKRNVADKSPRLDARITLRGSEITHHRTVARAGRRLRIVQSACRPLSVQRSQSGPLTRGGQMMTTSGENEPKATVTDGLEAWRETVAAARQARRQRGERYSGRHRSVSVDGADAQDATQRSA